MEALNVFWGLLIAAVLAEAVVTVINRLFAKYTDWQYWASIVVGVLIAVVYEIDLFDLVGLAAVVPFVGMVLTGLIISRGSNYVFDVLNRVKNPIRS